MAVELKKHGVAAVSLWPGAVKTELISDLVLEGNPVENENIKVPNPSRPNPCLLFLKTPNPCVCLSLSSRIYLRAQKRQK